MPRHKLSLPPSSWPADLRDRFERHSLSEAQRTRLGRALGRWFKIAADADPSEVSRETWLERTAGLSRQARNEVRQALALVFPSVAASLYAEDNPRTKRADPRNQLRAAITRNLARFPNEWRVAAQPLLHVDKTGLGDGILVQAWAPSSIERRLEAAAHHFDFCRAHGLAVDISPASVRAMLRAEQVRVETGKRRIGGVAIDMDGLAGIACAVRPNRSWAWLKSARDRVKKLAKTHGSRNASHAVDAAELRAAGQQLLAKADAAHAEARKRRAFVAAHTKARTALTMILLAESPIRITSCAEIELKSSLLSDLAGLFLDAASTKEGDRDQRAFSATLVDAIGRYVQRHRAVVAAPGETRLLVGDRGGPVMANRLSECLGDFTEPVFKSRVTPHAIRHSVGNFIVATAPEEAALASIILNHRSDTVTSVYQQRADQIAASRRLGEATEATAAALSVDTTPTRRRAPTSKRGKTRRRGKIPTRSQARAKQGVLSGRS